MRRTGSCMVVRAGPAVPVPCRSTWRSLLGWPSVGGATNAVAGRCANVLLRAPPSFPVRSGSSWRKSPSAPLSGTTPVSVCGRRQWWSRSFATTTDQHVAAVVSATKKEKRMVEKKKQKQSDKGQGAQDQDAAMDGDEAADEAGRLDKHTRAMLAWQRERWHLRQKQKKDDPNTTEISLNKRFRMTPVDSKIMDYINHLKLGRRRDEPLPLTDGKRKEQLAKSKTAVDKIWERKVTFVAGATKTESFIPPTLPEIAFIGRSNVGKSSLINALTMQGKVRVSDTPGETQQINWYHVGKHIALIDLPGYGFAYASEEKVKQWTELMREFLTIRKSLKRICVLLDARHGFKSADLEFLDMLDKTKRKYQVILTKADLVTPPDLARRYHLVQEELKKRRHALERIMMVSSWNGTGLTNLRVELSNLMEGVRPEISSPIQKPSDMLPDYASPNNDERVPKKTTPSRPPPRSSSRFAAGHAKRKQRPYNPNERRADGQDRNNRRPRSSTTHSKQGSKSFRPKPYKGSSSYTPSSSSSAARSPPSSSSSARKPRSGRPTQRAV